MKCCSSCIHHPWYKSYFPSQSTFTSLWPRVIFACDSCWLLSCRFSIHLFWILFECHSLNHELNLIDSDTLSSKFDCTCISEICVSRVNVSKNFLHEDREYLKVRTLLLELVKIEFWILIRLTSFISAPFPVNLTLKKSKWCHISQMHVDIWV